MRIALAGLALIDGEYDNLAGHASWVAKKLEVTGSRGEDRADELTGLLEDAVGRPGLVARTREELDSILNRLRNAGGE